MGFNMREALKNIQKFHTNNKLQQATWTYLVSYQLSSDTEKKLSKIFSILDKNQDGYISQQELHQGFDSFSKRGRSSSEIASIIRKVSSCKNNKINYKGNLPTIISHFN
jgi:Ca2+-binding EF-hand superfamily protein